MLVIFLIEHEPNVGKLRHLKLLPLELASQRLLLLFVRKMPSFKFSLMSITVHLYLYLLLLLRRVFRD